MTLYTHLCIECLSLPTDADQGPGGETCRGTFSTGCDPNGVCDYKANWVVMEDDTITFTVSAKTSDVSTQWVAIGFSDDRLMVSVSGGVSGGGREGDHDECFSREEGGGS